jgi:hypothetical protein
MGINKEDLEGQEGQMEEGGILNTSYLLQLPGGPAGWSTWELEEVGGVQDTSLLHLYEYLTIFPINNSDVV